MRHAVAFAALVGDVLVGGAVDVDDRQLLSDVP